MKKLLKKITSITTLCILTLSMATLAYADSPKLNTQENSENLIAANLDTVFEFLNTKTTQLSLDYLEEVEYNIPVSDGHIVNVTIRNEQDPRSRGVVGDSDNYYVKENTSYIYTLRINNIFLNSGSITYKIYYDVGSSLTSNNVYEIDPTYVDVSAVAPSSYNVSQSRGYIVASGGITAVTSGFVRFTSPLLSNIEYDIEVKIGSFSNGMLGFQYMYIW